jgi:predicted nucleic acid-binding protein
LVRIAHQNDDGAVAGVDVGDEVLAKEPVYPEARHIHQSERRLKGTPIGPYDVLIAGAAKACSATLVTRNTREFKRVQGLAFENC